MFSTEDFNEPTHTFIMSHLTQPEAAKCVNGFFLYLFGRENYKRWKDLKAKIRFKSETAFVSWLLDSGEIISDTCNGEFPSSSHPSSNDTSNHIEPPTVPPVVNRAPRRKKPSKAKKRSNSESSCGAVGITAGALTSGGSTDDMSPNNMHIKSEPDDDNDLYDIRHHHHHSNPLIGIKSEQQQQQQQNNLSSANCLNSASFSTNSLVNSTSFSDSVTVTKPHSTPGGTHTQSSVCDDYDDQSIGLDGVTSSVTTGLTLTDDLFAGLTSTLDYPIADFSDPYPFPYSSNLLNSLNLDQTYQPPATTKGTKKFKFTDSQQSREYEHVMELRKTFASVHKTSPSPALASSCRNQFKLTYTAISSTTVLVSIGEKSGVMVDGLSYPVSCELCGGQELSSERLLVTHAKKCHQINPFLCEACSKRFATKPSVESHIFWSCSAVDSDRRQNIVLAGYC